MARQVYFDPFGAYTEAYDRGVGRQIQLEGATRDARARDWDYENMAPLRLSAARRADTLGRERLPYDIRALGLNERLASTNLFDRESAALANLGKTYGTYAPFYTAAQQYLAGQYADPTAYGYRPGLTRYTTAQASPESEAMPAQSPEAYGIPRQYAFDIGGILPEYSDALARRAESYLTYPEQLQAAQQARLGAQAQIDDFYRTQILQQQRDQEDRLRWQELMQMYGGSTGGRPYGGVDAGTDFFNAQ